MAQSLKACLAFLILMAFVRSNQATVEKEYLPFLHFIVLKVEMKFAPPPLLKIIIDSPISD